LAEGALCKYSVTLHYKIDYGCKVNRHRYRKLPRDLRLR